MERDKNIWYLRGIKSLIITGILLLISVSSAYATVYYVSPNGSDNNNGSNDAPWATFAHAMTVLQPGDTLIIKDGTYRQSLNVTVSGTSKAYITIEAENEGSVVIDGEGVRVPCKISSQSYINWEGFTCANSSGSVVDISSSSYINVRRVFAHDAMDGGNYHVFNISNSSHVLIENCAAWGVGRKLYQAYDSSYTTFRRNWGKWTSYTTTSPVGGIAIYGTSNSIIENNIMISTSTRTQNIFGVICHYYNDSCDNNKFYGNISYDIGGNSYSFWIGSDNFNITGNTYINNVGISNGFGFYQRGDSNISISNLTIVSPINSSAYIAQGISGAKYTLDFAIGGTVKNSVLINSTGYGFYVDGSSPGSPSITTNFNNIYGNASGNYGGTATVGTGDFYTSPDYDIATYGKGAYLMIPDALQGKGENGADIGAEILYQYVNGELTSNKLWPWPMEDRICAETGYSVTYENGCVNGGGIWKTLDGVYPVTTLQADVTPPNPPTGLRVD